MDMVTDVEASVGFPTKDITSMCVSVHEGNVGTFVLVRGVKMLKIDTKEQLGDIFTKCLHRPPFEYLRKILMGW